MPNGKCRLKEAPPPRYRRDRDGDSVPVHRGCNAQVTAVGHRLERVSDEIQQGASQVACVETEIDPGGELHLDLDPVYADAVSIGPESAV